MTIYDFGHVSTSVRSQRTKWLVVKCSSKSSNLHRRPISPLKHPVTYSFFLLTPETISRPFIRCVDCVRLYSAPRASDRLFYLLRPQIFSFLYQFFFKHQLFPWKKKVKKGREREGSLNILKALFPFKDRPAASSAITPFVCQICLHIQYEGKKKKNLLDVA